MNTELLKLRQKVAADMGYQAVRKKAVADSGKSKRDKQVEGAFIDGRYATLMTVLEWIDELEREGANSEVQVQQP